VRNLRIACIGGGSIGERHLRNLISLGQKDLVVFDPDTGRAAGVAAKHAVERASSLDAAVEGSDVVLICSPPHLHREHILAASDGRRALFIEKPLVATVQDLDALAATSVTDARTFVACNFRFHPPMARLKALVVNGDLGKVYSLRGRFGQYLPDWRPTTDYRKGYSANRSLGGGIVLDRVHEFDYAVWLLGAVRDAIAVTARVGDLEIDVEDLAEITLQFQSGAIGQLHVDYLRPEYDCSCEVVGEHGLATWTFQSHSLEWYDRRRGERIRQQWTNCDVNTMYVEQMRHFLAVALNEAASSNTLSDATAVTRLAMRCRDGRSAST
jgi:predicted dehydrogenase